MDAVLGFLCTFVFLVLRTTTIYAVPPDACFANFRSDDCGQAPKPVVYYWKPGSRCEVGMWRGCLPNPNMFHDEYECIDTCIFAVRARPEDYHALVDSENLYPENAIPENAAVENVTSVNVTTQEGNAVNVTSKDGISVNVTAGGSNMVNVTKEDTTFANVTQDTNSIADLTTEGPTTEPAS